MSWSPSFIAALSANTLTPYVRLEFLSMPSSVNSGGVIFSSRAGEGHALISGFSSWSGTLTPAPCAVSVGGFEVQVAGDLRGILDDIHPGAIAQLWVHPTGDESAAEVWAVGPFERMVRTGMSETVLLRFMDLLGALYSRLTRDAGTLASSDESTTSLFYTLNTGAIVFSSGSSVDVSTSGTMTAISGAGNFDNFERENGEKGLLKVVNSNGDETLLEWDSKSSSTVLNMSGTGPQRGSGAITWTTFIGANPARVYPMVRIIDHPGVIFLKLLASSGVTGLTGTYDVLPASWGFDPGGFLYSLVDEADANVWIQDVIVPTTGNWIDGEWDLIADERQENALKWLTDHLLQAGIFPASRQGSITLRALQNLNPATTRQPNGLKTTGLSITDADIIEIVQWQYPAPEQEAVARYSRVITGEVYTSSTPTREGDQKGCARQRRVASRMPMVTPLSAAVVPTPRSRPTTRSRGVRGARAWAVRCPVATRPRAA